AGPNRSVVAVASGRCRNPRGGPARGCRHRRGDPATGTGRPADRNAYCRGSGRRTAAAMKLAVLPTPLQGLPWRVLIPLTLLVCFGAAVLYSAAAGSMQPYALSHLLRYAVFLVMAL